MTKQRGSWTLLTESALREKRETMKILFVYPKYPDTFWSFKHALRFVSKKALHPPLGLLTVAAMLPAAWEKRLIDMNADRIKDRDIQWADYVFIGAMAVQKESANEIIARCMALHVKTVAGGPLFTAAPDDFPDVDHLVLNEAEATLPQFLKDLARGEARRLYELEGFSRPGEYANPSLASHQDEEILCHESSIFPGLPV